MNKKERKFKNYTDSTAYFKVLSKYFFKKERKRELFKSRKFFAGNPEQTIDHKGASLITCTD